MKFAFAFLLAFSFCSVMLPKVHAALSSECTKGILLNAEAFGFGPTAAIAQLFPQMREHSGRMGTLLGYVGEAHTMGLQSALAYDDLVRLQTGASDDEIRQALRKLKSRYQYFFTAIDYRFAKIAKEEGFIVGLYDPLTWFWGRIPEHAKDLDLYVAQDFVGVQDRLEKEPRSFPRDTVLVPPIVEPLKGLPLAERENRVLINLGGLSNPFIGDELILKFVTTVAHLSAAVLVESEGAPEILITTKPDFIAQMPKTIETSSLNPKQIQARLETERLAIMTSGLGNIFEASSANSPVIWLPPTNDSQGQQVQQLKREGFVDWALDWQDFLDLPAIDYFQPQKIVMEEIRKRMEIFVESRISQERFENRLREKSKQAFAEKNLKIHGLVERYGQGGLSSWGEILRGWTSR